MTKRKPRTPEQRRLNNEAARRSRAKRRNNDPEGYRRAERDKEFKYRYGITLADYEAMYAEQAGKCALCDAAHATLSVDHCHDSKAVRGLLCQPCNMAIGLLKDRTDVLLKAVSYINDAKTDCDTQAVA